MDGLDIQSTYVLLIGEADYPNWPQMNIPNVHVNLEELAALLSDPDYCGIPGEKIRIVKDEDVEATSSAIYDFFDGIQTNNATVILYYSGHGLQSTKAMDDLFLATKNIRENKFEPSAIKISELRKLFSDCPAARKILLLDCCYAGKITKGFLSDDRSETIAKLNEFEGTYIMAASSEFERARFDPDNPNSPTKFTGKFVEVIKTGIDEADEYCTLNAIYNKIRISFLAEQDAPKPVQVEQNNIANFPLFKNKKFAERMPEDERAWKETLTKNNTVAYYKFKEQFPNSEFVKEADKKIDEIEDENAWQKAKIRDTIGSYDFYLENYNDGVHIEEAKKRLAELTLIEQTNDDEKKLWLKAQADNDLNSYKVYTDKYPSGRFASEALARIKDIQQQEKEESSWKEVSAKNSLLSYQQYLKNYPHGKYADEARHIVALLSQKEKQSRDAQKNVVNPEKKSSSKTLKLVLWIGAGIIILSVIINLATKDNSSGSKNQYTSDSTSIMSDSAGKTLATPHSETSSTNDYNYYWNLGNTDYGKQDYQAALTDYTNAINLNNNEQGLYFNRGLCYSNLKNYNSAVVEFTSAIRLYPDYGDAYAERGNAYYYLSNMDAACADYKKAADLNNEEGKKNYAQYCSGTSTSSASIDNISVDITYDVTSNNQKGMKIFPHFTVKNAKGKWGTINAYFYYRDHKTPLKDNDKSYYTVEGNVSTWDTIVPAYDPATYNGDNNNFPLFIPYSQLDLDQSSGKKYLLSFYVTVFIDNKQLVSSDWYDFDVTF